jgi:hypothetical protein
VPQGGWKLLRSTRFSTALVGVMLVALTACGGGKSVDAKVLDAQIHAKIFSNKGEFSSEAQYQQALKIKVDCPSGEPKKAGTVFVCHLTNEPSFVSKYNIQVTILNSKGDYKVTNVSPG